MNEMLNTIPPMAYAVIILIGFCALFGAAYYALKNGKLFQRSAGRWHERA